jgi:hypothetical protein
MSSPSAPRPVHIIQQFDDVTHTEPVCVKCHVLYSDGTTREQFLSMPTVEEINKNRDVLTVFRSASDVRRCEEERKEREAETFRAWWHTTKQRVLLKIHAEVSTATTDEFKLKWLLLNPGEYDSKLITKWRLAAGEWVEQINDTLEPFEWYMESDGIEENESGIWYLAHITADDNDDGE